MERMTPEQLEKMVRDGGGASAHVDPRIVGLPTYGMDDRRGFLLLMGQGRPKHG